MPRLTVIFDLDGTLVDTAPDLVRAANYSLAQAGLPPVSADVITPFVGFGARRMIVAGLSAHGVSLNDTAIDDLLARYLSFYADNIAVESRPYPRVVEEIEILRQRGAAIAICTNKLEAMSRRLIGALALEHHFAAIVGRDTLPVCKPHPDHLLAAILRAGGDPATAVMVGDTETDIATARAARVPVIGVSFGYSPVPIDRFAPDLVMDQYGGLADRVQRLLEHAGANGQPPSRDSSSGDG